MASLSQPALPAHAYIGLGSNLGNGRLTLQSAWRRLTGIQGIVAESLSSPYLTAPVAMSSEHWFTNAVGKLTVSVGPLELLEAMLEIECQFGRRRDQGVDGYQDRSLDLDLLYFADLRLDLPELSLPHPRIAERLFVLVPLAELEPDLIEPQSGLTVVEMVAALRQRLESSAQDAQAYRSADLAGWCRLKRADVRSPRAVVPFYKDTYYYFCFFGKKNIFKALRRSEGDFEPDQTDHPDHPHLYRLPSGRGGQEKEQPERSGVKVRNKAVGKWRFIWWFEGEAGSVSDILEEDPICHKLVPRQQAVRLVEGEVEYYFCSESCRRAFAQKQGEQQ